MLTRFAFCATARSALAAGPGALLILGGLLLLISP
jgi:hypothetical protein